MRGVRHHGTKPGPHYDVDTPASSRLHADLRSASLSIKRGRDDYHKYLRYQAINRSSRTQPWYSLSASPHPNWWVAPPSFDGCDVVDTMPKREFYNLAKEAKVRHLCSCMLGEDQFQGNQFHKWKKGVVMAKWEIDAARESWRGLEDSLADALEEVEYRERFMWDEDACFDVNMDEIIRLRGPSFAVKSDPYGLLDDDCGTESLIDAWSDAGSTDSWEMASESEFSGWEEDMDDVSVLEKDDCESEWSEVEG